jgi:hypothetical protein
MNNPSIQGKYADLIKDYLLGLNEKQLFAVLQIVKNTVDTNEFDAAGGISDDELKRKLIAEYEKAKPIPPSVRLAPEIEKIKGKMGEHLTTLSNVRKFLAEKQQTVSSESACGNEYHIQYGDRYHTVTIIVSGEFVGAQWFDEKAGLTHKTDVKNFNEFVSWFDEFN